MNLYDFRNNSKPHEPSNITESLLCSLLNLFASGDKVAIIDKEPTPGWHVQEEIHFLNIGGIISVKNGQPVFQTKYK